MARDCLELGAGVAHLLRLLAGDRQDGSPGAGRHPDVLARPARRCNAPSAARPAAHGTQTAASSAMAKATARAPERLGRRPRTMRRAFAASGRTGVRCELNTAVPPLRKLPPTRRMLPSAQGGWTRRFNRFSLESRSADLHSVSAIVLWRSQGLTQPLTAVPCAPDTLSYGIGEL